MRSSIPNFRFQVTQTSLSWYVTKPSKNSQVLMVFDQFWCFSINIDKSRLVSMWFVRAKEHTRVLYGRNTLSSPKLWLFDDSKRRGAAAKFVRNGCLAAIAQKTTTLPASSTDQYELYQNQIELQGVKRVKNSVQGQFFRREVNRKLVYGSDFNASLALNDTFV